MATGERGARSSRTRTKRAVPATKFVLPPDVKSREKVWLRRRVIHLELAPVVELPDGYRWRWFVPCGRQSLTSRAWAAVRYTSPGPARPQEDRDGRERQADLGRDKEEVP
jgi:hypothetical protein